jgi:hypothetical protein
MTNGGCIKSTLPSMSASCCCSRQGSYCQHNCVLSVYSASTHFIQKAPDSMGQAICRRIFPPDWTDRKIRTWNVFKLLRLGFLDCRARHSCTCTLQIGKHSCSDFLDALHHKLQHLGYGELHCTLGSEGERGAPQVCTEALRILM